MSDKLIEVAKLGRAHGIEGAVRAFMDDEESDTLLRVKTLFLRHPSQNEALPFKVRKAKTQERFVALWLENIDDRDKAMAWVGARVLVQRSQLRALKDAYYACDLVGLKLVSADGTLWGSIESVIPGAAQDLLRYQNSEGQHGLVPFAPAHIEEPDFERGTITVDGEWMAALNAYAD